MKNRAAVLLGILLVINLHASPLEDKIKALNDALRGDAPAGSPRNSMVAGRMIPLLDPSTYPGGDAGLESTVEQVIATSSSPAVQKAGEELLTELKAEHKARTDAVVSKIDAILSRAPAIVQQAQKPADLDGILGDIQAAIPANANYGMDLDAGAEANRLNSAYQFISQWQDYLSHRDAGNNQEALNSLRNLSEQRPPGEPIIPRSDILDRIAALEAQTPSPSGAPVYHPAPIDPILESIKNLDDIAPAARKAMVTDGQSFDSARLNQIANRLAQAKYGLPISLDFAPNNNGLTPQPGFAHVDSMVLLYLLPRFLGPPAPAPAAGETVSDYLERVLNGAASTPDLPLLQRALAAKAQLAGFGPGQFSQGFQSVQSAINQEIAGQYAAAVQSYENALRTSDANTPATLIGQRLAAIKKDHAAELAEAAKIEQANPAPMYYPGYNPYFRPGMPGYPGGYPAPGIPGMTPSPPAAPANPGHSANKSNLASPSTGQAPATTPKAKAD